MHQAQGNEYPKESGVKNKGEKLLKISSSFTRRHFIRVLTAYRGRRTCARTWRKGGTITEEALFDGSMIGYRSDRRRSSWFLAILGLTKCIQLQTIAPFNSGSLKISRADAWQGHIPPMMAIDIAPLTEVRRIPGPWFI